MRRWWCGPVRDGCLKSAGEDSGETNGRRLCRAWDPFHVRPAEPNRGRKIKTALIRGQFSGSWLDLSDGHFFRLTSTAAPTTTTVGGRAAADAMRCVVCCYVNLPCASKYKRPTLPGVIFSVPSLLSEWTELTLFPGPWPIPKVCRMHVENCRLEYRESVTEVTISAKLF